jgi:intracellular septation protein
MKLLYDFFPVLLFFISFKLWGIYTATVAAIIASFLQVIGYWAKHRSFERMHLVTLALIVVLGGATLVFHDPMFIKWKPTGIYWISAIVFFLSNFIGKSSLVQKMMEKNIDLPAKVWTRLNYAWVIFFSLMGALNIYVAYNYSTNAWVNFKLFGGMGITLLFVFLQAIYLSKHISEDKVSQQTVD